MLIKIYRISKRLIWRQFEFYVMYKAIPSICNYVRELNSIEILQPMRLEPFSQNDRIMYDKKK